MQDILTDLVAYESDKELSLSEIVADGSAHEGMTMAARNLKMKLLGGYRATYLYRLLDDLIMSNMK